MDVRVRAALGAVLLLLATACSPADNGPGRDADGPGADPLAGAVAAGTLSDVTLAPAATTTALFATTAASEHDVLVGYLSVTEPGLEVQFAAPGAAGRCGLRGVGAAVCAIGALAASAPVTLTARNLADEALSFRWGVTADARRYDVGTEAAPLALTVGVPAALALRERTLAQFPHPESGSYAIFVTAGGMHLDVAIYDAATFGTADLLQTCLPPAPCRLQGREAELRTHLAFAQHATSPVPRGALRVAVVRGRSEGAPFDPVSLVLTTPHTAGIDAGGQGYYALDVPAAATGPVDAELVDLDLPPAPVTDTPLRLGLYATADHAEQIAMCGVGFATGAVTGATSRDTIRCTVDLGEAAQVFVGVDNRDAGDAPRPTRFRLVLTPAD